MLRQDKDFNDGWSFQLNSQPTTQNWRTVSLPHDWSVEAKFDPSLEGATAYLPGGIGWYQKYFQLKLQPKQRAYLIFDGIYNHASLELNGQNLHYQVFGYSPFYLDITDYLQAENHLLIKVDRSRIADSRWYSGSGIYREVRLLVVNQVHVAPWDNFIFATQACVSQASLTQQLQVAGVRPGASLQVRTRLINAAGQVCAETTHQQQARHNSVNFALQLTVDAPQLWCPESPSLYRAITEVLCDGQLSDSFEQQVGIRHLYFDPKQGFYLNHQAYPIKGVCLHHEAGAVGAAVPDGVWLRRLTKLKDAGVNAIRIAHHPASCALLSLCDRLGLLVQDEFFDEWDYPKDKRLNMHDQHGDPLSEGYASYFAEHAQRDLTNALKAHRNHPCVFMWSIGNEIEWTYPRNVQATGFFDASWDGNYFWSQPPNSREKIAQKLTELPQQEQDIGRTAQRLAKWVKDLDQSRPVTANCILPSASYESGYAQALDVIGFSYRQVMYDYGRQHYPSLPIIGNEVLPQWHEWKAASARPHVAGVFLWTGIDYLGEVHQQWPTRSLAAGLLDTAGFTKPTWQMFRSLWQQQPVLALYTRPFDHEQFVHNNQVVSAKDPNAWQQALWIWPQLNQHWNYQDQDIILVEAISNCPELELFVNGSSVGKRQLSQQADRIFRWAVPFSAGELRLEARDEHGNRHTEQLSTSDDARQLALSLELSEDNLVAHLIAQLVDKQGLPVCHQQRRVEFSADNNAHLLGVDNGSASNVEAFTGPTLNTSKGRALAIFKRSTPTQAVQLGAALQGGQLQQLSWPAA